MSFTLDQQMTFFMRSALTVSLVCAPGVAPAITVTSDSGQKNVAGACTLRDAITAANFQEPTGGCEAGIFGVNTIELPRRAHIVLSEVDNVFGGANGLPYILFPLVIHGNDSVISHSGACTRGGEPGGPGQFRFFRVQNAALWLDSLTLRGGCGTYGGAVYMTGTQVHLRKVTVSGAYSEAAGAIAVAEGNLILEDTSIIDNESYLLGASALYAAGDVSVFATNTTFSGNIVGPPPSGAPATPLPAVAFDRVRMVELSHVTITSNDGSAAYFRCSTDPCITVKNAIIAGNAGNDCQVTGAPLTVIGQNLAGDGTCPGFSIPSTQPSLGPLGDNGGPTPTHAPLPGSPAIDAVTDCTTVASLPLASDQRGFMRPWDGDGNSTRKCDLGAVEAKSASMFRDGFEE